MAAKKENTEKAETVEKTESAKKPEKKQTGAMAEGAARTRKAKKTEPEQAGQTECGEQNLTRDDIIGRYLEIYRRCMTEDPKSFDARGAAHALEQISKLLGLTVSAKDTDGNEIVLTLSEEADAFGQ